MLHFAIALCSVVNGPAPCTHTGLPEVCDAPHHCNADNTRCPPVTTELSCGEIPHSARDGKVLTFGVSYRANSAQDCCDKCKKHPRGCNSWTFCALPVCWGLDTGWNHTYGECWLRRLEDGDVHAAKSFRVRGRYTTEWLRRHRNVRPGCKKGRPWTCPPLAVPWTSGALSGPAYDPSEKYVTGGGWGHVWVKPEGEVVSARLRTLE
mmetsp:Transcript_44020/g.93713  ORF Transcript_44020/g.93713 Transcript_44020/m.93713 type:complete len:207 (+) Transcript_44020:136-756(+)